MRRLRPTDGTVPHRAAALVHIAKCRAGKAPIHATLYGEMKALYDDLRAKARAVEDAEDDLVTAGAVSEAAEEALEDVIRDADSDFARLEREDPSLSVRATVFPNGFGVEIDPDGERQLEVLPALKARFGQLQGLPVVAAALARVEEKEAGLRAAFAAEDEASEKVEALFARELEARRAIREQMESAYGRLRDYYKARPALAEKFFQKEGRARKAEAKKGAGPSPAPVGERGSGTA